MEYWNMYPKQRPSYLPLQGQALFHWTKHVRRHLLMHQILPQFSQQQITEHAHFVEALMQVFPTPGLYCLMVKCDSYPQGGQECFCIYPGPTTNVSIFNIAAWFAHCGLTEESIELMVPMAVHYHHKNKGCHLHSSEEFTSWPAHLMDINHVPMYTKLSWPSTLTLPSIADNDAPMDKDDLDIGQPSTILPVDSGPLVTEENAATSGLALMDKTPDPIPSTPVAPSIPDAMPSTSDSAITMPSTSNAPASTTKAAEPTPPV